MNLVLFTPDDLQLVKGDPSLRRRFLDMEIAQTSRFYYEALQNYNRVLQQRNRFLRHCRDQEKLDEGQLFVWDEALSRSAAVIVFERLKAMEEIERAAGLVYGTITQDREKMTLSYLQKRSDGEGVPPKGLSLSEWQAFYQEELKKRHRLDYVRGYTSMGPHRDDLEILQEGRPLRSFGSQGQQRTAALALKLSELEFIFTARKSILSCFLTMCSVSLTKGAAACSLMAWAVRFRPFSRSMTAPWPVPVVMWSFTKFVPAGWRKMLMKDIDCLIMAALKTDLAKEKYVLYRLRKDWALIVGEAAARHSQPYRLQHATLFIHTDNPSWSHNFLTMQGKLLAAIGKALPRKMDAVLFL